MNPGEGSKLGRELTNQNSECMLILPNKERGQGQSRKTSLNIAKWHIPLATINKRIDLGRVYP